MDHVYALKIHSADRTVVFSADTCYFPPLIEFSRGADVLVHEVMHLEGSRRMCERLKDIKPNLMAHMIAAHCPGDDVGRIASEAGVGSTRRAAFHTQRRPGDRARGIRGADPRDMERSLDHRSRSGDHSILIRFSDPVDIPGSAGAPGRGMKNRVATGPAE